jgi:magnesium chelatase family protein
VLPSANAPEAALIEGLRVVPVDSLGSAAAALQRPDPRLADPVDAAALLSCSGTTGADMADVAGQAQARRALEIAAAGGHNLLMVGPPGSGKTMLARRLPTILPPLSVPEAFEVTRIVSVAGLLPVNEALVRRRPFRAPHHSISTPGLVGGGGTPRPGEASLAHLGVLFLDEFPEFRTSALEALRQPLEDGEVTISRALTSLTFPARFMLVAAMNPCPCGYRGDPGRECTCPLPALHRYRSRLSGPLLDRIDMCIEVPRLEPGAWRTAGGAEASAQIRRRVTAARERQHQRLRGESEYANAHLSSRQVRRLCDLSPAAVDMVDGAYTRLRLTARACDRLVKVAQTIADLSGAGRIEREHVSEALAYRGSTRAEASDLADRTLVER